MPSLSAISAGVASLSSLGLQTALDASTGNLCGLTLTFPYFLCFSSNSQYISISMSHSRAVSQSLAFKKRKAHGQSHVIASPVPHSITENKLCHLSRLHFFTHKMDKRTPSHRIMGRISKDAKAESGQRWAVNTLTPTDCLLITLILFCSLDQQ